MPARSRGASLASAASSTKKDHDRPLSSPCDTKKAIPLSPLSPRLPGPPTIAHSHKHKLSNGKSGKRNNTLLPPPVQHTSSSSSRKKLRIIGGGLHGRGGGAVLDAEERAPGWRLSMRVHWGRFLRRFGTGTAPSSSSLLDGSTADGSGVGVGVGRRSGAERGGGGGGGRDRDRDEKEDGELEEPLDEVVVERDWSDSLHRSTGTGTGSAYSDHGAAPEKDKEKEKERDENNVGGTNTDVESFALRTDGVWGKCKVLAYARWRAWPFVVAFFFTRFLDDKAERQYRFENWWVRKKVAIWSALFFILNWTLAAAIVPKPYILPDIIFYYIITPALTFPLLLMVAYDMPRDYAWLYQPVLLLSTWSWGIYQLVSIHICHFYTKTPTRFPCNNKDFLSTFYYTNALQTIALFGLNLHRFPAMVGPMAFFILAFALVVPDRGTFSRNTVNFFCFQWFLLYVHYMRESAERRLYILRDKLKSQFRATQKAQINERKAADSKRRLTSYVFHEVRVPLNTALLAVQNMHAARSASLAGVGAVGGQVFGTGVGGREGGTGKDRRDDSDQDIEFRALEGSLVMMSKVLNDVLDFNRMDSGRFESVHRPYAFHKVMRSLFVPLRLATDSRGLRFVTELDGRIDRVARRALYESLGVEGKGLGRRRSVMRKDGDGEEDGEEGEEDGIVVGDETRLRQIITNLASNACKFTAAGGQLTIRTRLIVPAEDAAVKAGGEEKVVEVVEVEEKERDKEANGGSGSAEQGTSSTAVSSPGDELGLRLQLSASHLSRHNDLYSKPPPLDVIVVRIEVSDTGCGIKRRDMIHSKLFSAFNQTEMGRQQGGKGTGLGLALVRQIVKLSGGRLGVQSKVGEGSTFWVELPLGVGVKAQPGLAEAVETPDIAAESHLAKMWEASDGTLVANGNANANGRELMSNNSPSCTRTASSAMHSIMEQGGLVEISARREDPSQVLTRTIGDPSTGTDPLTPGIPEESSPSSQQTDLPPPPAHLPSYTAAQSRAHATIRDWRPSYLELPARPDFTLDQIPVSLAPPSSSPTLTRQGLDFASPPQQQQQPQELLRVLVVDDDPLTRKLMSRMLSRLGNRVSTAENGEIALEMILGVRNRTTPSSEETGSAGLCVYPPGSSAEHGTGAASTPGGASVGPTMAGHEYKYAVVFLDNQMPVMSGLELVAKLREMGRQDFVVGVTGNALLSDQQEYMEAGADHILTKPVHEKSLRAMLAVAEERRRAMIASDPPPQAPDSTAHPQPGSIQGSGLGS